jgi:hypothetical protein
VVIFSTRGGEYSQPFSAAKRHDIRRGHTALAVTPLFGLQHVSPATKYVEVKYHGLNHYQIGRSDEVLKHFLQQLADAGVPLKKK